MKLGPSARRWLCVALVAAMIGSAEASAQEHWVAQDLFGGEAYQVVFDHQNGQRAFVATVGGIFRTTDGASNWQSVQQGLGVAPLTTLTVAPSDGARLYAVRALPELYLSTDGGDSWRVGYRCKGCDGGFQQLAVDPVDPQTVYACDMVRGVQVSRDGGATLAVEDGPGCSRQLLAPAAGMVFAVSSNIGLSRSLDHGASWSSVNPIAGFEATGAAVDPLDSQRVYLSGRDPGGSASFWVSTDGGERWVASGLGLSSEGSVSVAPSDPSTLYFWNGFGLWLSTDFGASFAPPSTSFGLGVGFRALAVDPLDSSIALAITWQGSLMRVSQRGEIGTPAQEGIRSGSVRSLRVDAQHPGRMLALQNRALWRRNKDGDLWRRSSLGLPPTPVAAYWLYPPNTIRTFLSTDGRFWRSLDGGGSFDPIAEISFSALVFDPRDPDTMIGGGSSPGLSRSTDGGFTWAPWSSLPLGSLVLGMVFDPLDSSTLFVGTVQGLYRTADAGHRWALLDLPGGVVRAGFHPQRPDLLFALAGAELFRSDDGGESWTIALAGQSLLDFAFAGPDSPLLYAVGDHVFRSTNLGGVWEQLPEDGLVEAGGQSLAVDSRSPWQPFLGTFRHGLYQLETRVLFADGFETGDTSAWSLTLP